MIVEFLTVAMGYVALEGAVAAINWVIKKRNSNALRSACSEFLVDPVITHEDEEMIKKINDLMVNQFHDGVSARFMSLNIIERQKLVKEIIEELQKIYDIDLVNINFLHSEELGYGVLGYFNEKTQNISINIDYVAANEPEILYRLLGTLIHECRHAYQFKAVKDNSKDIGSEEQRRLWGLNWVKYIPAEVDFDLYTQQIIEGDARFVAEKSLAGVNK